MSNEDRSLLILHHKKDAMLSIDEGGELEVYTQGEQS